MDHNNQRTEFSASKVDFNSFDLPCSRSLPNRSIKFGYSFERCRLSYMYNDFTVGSIDAVARRVSTVKITCGRIFRAFIYIKRKCQPIADM